MAIPNGVIFIWTGTHASIPAGWSRVLELDDRFPKGDATPNIIGGTSTHTHTTTANHSHTMSDHTHAFTIGNHPINAVPSGGGQTYAEPSHNHGGSGTTGSASGGELQSIASSYSSVSNNPPYYSVIYITPATSAGGIPNLSLGLYEDNDFTSSNIGKFTGYYECDGNNSTPDLRNKYLLGASTGANAGATGGSLTNSHNLTHSHTVNSHTHGNASTPASVNITASTSTSSDKIKNHSHTVSFGNATVTINNDPAVTTSESVEPAYKKLLAIQNRSSTSYTPVGIIGLWLGSIANIPTNFEVVSSMYNYHLKIASIYTEIGNTGGSNTHSHTNSTHTHTGSSHTHTISGLDHNAVGIGGSTGSYDASARPSVSHPSSMTAGTTTYSTGTTSSDSVSNEPSFRTVAFIKYKGETGGSFIFNLL